MHTATCICPLDFLTISLKSRKKIIYSFETLKYIFKQSYKNTI